MKVIQYLILTIILFACLSGKTIELNSGTTNSTVTLLEETNDHIILEYRLHHFESNQLRINGNAYSQVILEGEPNFLQVGAPALPHINRSIIIKDTGGTHYEVLQSEMTEFEKYRIPASKGNQPRNIDLSLVPYAEGISYTKNEFFPGEILQLNEPYILRDFRGQVVQFNPFQYNPVSEVLKVYHHLKVKIIFNEKETKNPFHKKSRAVQPTLDFNHIYQNHFLNYGSSNRYTPVSEDGEMLIICYDSFMDAMEPFVEWKNQKGIKTTMVPKSEAGSNYTSIKNYIEDFYDSHNLAFVLLVGDISQIPAISTGSGWSSGESDPWYSYMSGNDSYPEFFVGRFSAENISHVNTQVERSIEYERDPQTGASWYRKGVMVASNEGAGAGDDGEADWQHARNMRLDLMQYTYSSVDEMYDGTHGGQDANGNPNSTLLKNALNDGRSILHYTGHGETTNLVTTNFSTSHVNQLVNENELPFVCGVGCISGNFAGYTCLAETFQRATNNGEPTGAIATFMSTIYMGWAPPMSAQDEMVDILVESYTNNRKVTFGGVSFNGCLKMNDEYGSSGDDETDHWTIFGDPSIVLRTDTPNDISVNHSGNIESGAASYHVQITGGGSFHLAALSNNGEYLGAAYADDSGTAQIEFEGSIESDDDILLTVTGFNTTTVMETVSVGGGCGEILMGDANGDTVVNILDVILTVNFVLDTEEAGECQLEALDFNNDSILNIMDIISLINVILGN